MIKKRIAIPIDEKGILDEHFGHCQYFALIDTEDDKITAEVVVNPPPHEPGILPKWLAKQGASDVLAGGMGHKAIQIFNYNEINVFVGAPKLTATELAIGFTKNEIEFKANYCDH